MSIWRSNRTTQVCVLTSMFLIGVLVSRLGPTLFQLMLLALTAVILLCFGIRLGLLTLLFMASGWYRGTMTTLAHSAIGRDVGRNVVVSGRISDDPGVSTNFGQTQAFFTLSHTVVDGKSAHQSVKIYTAGYKDLKRGCTVQAQGKVKVSRYTGAPYISYAQVDILSLDIGWLERTRQNFISCLHAVIPEPMSGFGLGILIGSRSLIDQKLQNDLNTAGLSHIVAVSGYNLTIIIQMTQRLNGYLSYFSTTALSVWLIVGFLLVTGFSASIVRAAMVAAIGMLTSYYGYRVSALTLLAVPAILTTSLKPDYLVEDLGWQLSFLAFFGILVLAPLLTRRFIKYPNNLKLMLVEGLSAQIMTIPLIMAVFGRLSLVSLASNVIILPLVPLAMLLSFLTGTSSMLSGWLGAWVSLPATGLMALMLGLVQWFARWPHASIQISFQPPAILFCYACIVCTTCVLWHRSKYDCVSRK